VAARIGNNAGAVFEDELTGQVAVLPGTDVLTLRGFFEQAPYYTDPDPGGISAAGSDLTISGNGGVVRVRSPITVGERSAVPAEGSGIVLMGRHEYAVAELTSVPTTPQWLTIPGRPGQSLAETSFRVTTLGFTGGTLPWSRFNPNGVYEPPSFPVYQVGVLESYTYFVDPQLRLMRVRRRAGRATAVEPVAMHIGGLQAALAVDLDHDGQIGRDEWLSDPEAEVVAAGTVMMLRITVLGLTPFPVDGWREPAATFAVEDMSPPGHSWRQARWCRMQVTARLRSFMP
jgi:hypothetical protein